MPDSPTYISDYPTDSGIKPSTDGNQYLAWLHNILSQMRPAPEDQPSTPVKRFSDFSVPYFKYRQDKDKRNDGIWIWMPAQGYVSVPKQQQAIGDEASGKPGKIMRYGK
nr:NKY-2 [Urechis unicinctus]